MNERLIIFLKGAFMGAADIVPGVSGGTIALITGIYQRLISGINHVFELVNLELFNDIIKLRFNQIWLKIKSIDFWFFLPLLSGIITSFLVLANFIHYMMQNHIAVTYAFFAGLILASAIFLFRQLGSINLVSIVYGIIGFAFGFVLVGIDALQTSHTLFIIFISGAIAITAMILPGISGSFTLVLLNQYEYMLNAIHTINLKEIIIFMLGAIFGLGLFSRLVHHLIKNFKAYTISFLIGLMLGSLRLQINVINDNVASTNYIWIFISSIIGFLIVFLFENMSKFKNNIMSLIEDKGL